LWQGHGFDLCMVVHGSVRVRTVSPAACTPAATAVQAVAAGRPRWQQHSPARGNTHANGG
jgi:hypothetical protein